MKICLRSKPHLNSKGRTTVMKSMAHRRVRLKILVQSESRRGLCTLHAFRTGEVAQVSQPAVSPTSSRQALDFPAVADWKSATQQTGSLRYGAPSRSGDAYKVQRGL